METICTNNPAVLRPLYEEMTLGYQKAFEGKPWFEVTKCLDAARVSRTNCVGKFSRQAVGEVCGDCRARLDIPAYTEAECRRMFDDFLADGGVYYLELDGRGVIMTTIGVPKSAEELAKSKYSDCPEMASWLAETLPGDTRRLYLAESFARLDLRPKGNMARRAESVRSLAAQTGLDEAATRTISPEVIAATLRDFPDARLYLPSPNYQSDWNAGIQQFAELAVGEVPDRRAFIVFGVTQ